ncbi:MAG: hypothetical protein ACI9EV_002934 [Urechidicola sp.]|jgi:hypothetical protein
MKRKLHLRKFALTLSFLFCLALGAQVVNGDFEAWTGDVPDGWTTIESGIATTEEGSVVHGGDAAAAINVITGTQGDTDFRQVVDVVAGTTYNISFWAYHTEGGMRARLFVDDFLDYTDPAVTGEWQELSYTYLAGATGSIDVGLRFYDLPAFDGEELVYIDDFSMDEEVIVGPSIVLTAPADGSTILSDAITATVVVTNFEVGNGTGDGYIVHDLNGSTGDHFTTDAFTLNGLSDGDYTLTVSLVDGSGAPLSPAANSTVMFTVAIPTLIQVSTIAELRAGNIGDLYELTGEAILTYQQSFRNQKYIQDATAGILIDDNDGTIISTFNINDGITGLSGTLGEFGDMMQFVPISDPGVATSNGNSFDIPNVTLADLANNFDDHEAEVVNVISMSFDDGGTILENGTVYGISDPSGSYNLRTTFFDVDYIGMPATSFTLDVRGIPNSRVDGEYFTPRNLTDILPLGIEELNTLDLSIYPNPNNGTFTLQNSALNLDMTIQVTDITGRIVFESNAILAPQERININTNLTDAGLYNVVVRDFSTGIISSMTMIVN